MITAIAAAVVGVIAGVVATRMVAARREDVGQLHEFHIHREVATLREQNARLSQHCGHCGTARALPAPGGPR
ncbi:hypothetical protein Q7689_01055 [Nocardiopsis tropica]|uniref:hypothetical protein n=1 Tax=Nocardiopsis tropica TaxID=109330 RepID=UPI002E88FA67|nr:hypothetical protein [Nocardiopsis tropica]